jgi:hypothetical protein
MKKTFWISFATDETGNLGCCIVDAKNETDAIKKTWKLKINPGGQAMLTEYALNESAKIEIAKWGKNKLISPEDLMNDGYKKLKDLDLDLQDKITNLTRVSGVCEKHNKK